jgi:MoxR-like ATPase
MPSDITGTEVIEEDKTTGQRELRFVKGPIFANVILADEINRTPPKTQAALLEAMQERHVTVGGVQHQIPNPFFVLATQNPIEQEGTYPLPEAQLDRFMFMIQISYPDQDQELEIVRRSTTKRDVKINAVLNNADILRVQELVRAAPVADHVIRYALRLVRATRIKEPMDSGLKRAADRRGLRGLGRRPARERVHRPRRQGPRPSSPAATTSRRSISALSRVPSSATASSPTSTPRQTRSTPTRSSRASSKRSRSKA